ncbi:GNAT family N-acetyltransferase [Flindersiella endophytica]
MLTASARSRRDHRLGVDPATTTYVAELGVAAHARRLGIARRLLEDVHAGLPPQTTACVVRTLASNAPAIALYRRHDYTLVPDLIQPWNGRDRVFLRHG